MRVICADQTVLQLIDACPSMLYPEALILHGVIAQDIELTGKGISALQHLITNHRSSIPKLGRQPLAPLARIRDLVTEPDDGPGWRDLVDHVLIWRTAIPGSDRIYGIAGLLADYRKLLKGRPSNDRI